jgi:hypothetical protein
VPGHARTSRSVEVGKEREMQAIKFFLDCYGVSPGCERVPVMVRGDGGRLLGPGVRSHARNRRRVDRGMKKQVQVIKCLFWSSRLRIDF